MNQNNFKEHIAAAYLGQNKTDQSSSEGVVRSLRQQAFESFSRLSFPTKKDEQWKYTNLESLYAKKLSVTNSNALSLTSAVVSNFSIPNVKCYTLVFINGKFNTTFSDITGLNGLVDVFPLSEAVKSIPNEISSVLQKKSNNDRDVFDEMNASFLNDGIYLRIKSGKIIDQPILLLFVSDSQSDNALIQPRNIIVGGKSSEATVIERYVSLQNESEYLTNSVTTIIAEENSTLHHVRIQEESGKAFHVCTVESHLDSNSTVNSHVFSIGSGLTRNNITANLNAENANVFLNGLYLTTHSQHVDNHTVINHFKPNCNSIEVYKGILDDKSTGVFDGKIVVHKDAQKTSANQSNKNLLLSNNAHANAKPQLEIYADDVKCFHGATVGQLDETQLFYLKSRGIGNDFAKALLTHAFAADVLQSIKNPSLQEFLDEIIMKKLHSPILNEN